MDKALNFKFQNLPYPISGVLAKYSKIKKNNLSEKHAVLGDIFESIIKFLAIVMICETSKEDLRKNYSKGMDFLKHPALGSWVQALRDIPKNLTLEESTYSYKISNWFNNETKSPIIKEAFSEIKEAKFIDKSGTVYGAINGLTTYRNKVWKGHGAYIVDEERLSHRINALETILFYLITQANFLKSMPLIYTNEVRKLDSGLNESDSTILTGSNYSLGTHVYSNFDPNEVYLLYSSEYKQEKRPIKLTSFLFWHPQMEKLYFLNDIKKSYIEYLSYSDGTFFNYKEIKGDLAKYIDVDLIDIDEIEDDFIKYNISDEDRKLKADYYYKEGLKHITDKNYSLGIISFENAIAWYRLPEYFVNLCKCMLKTGEDLQYIENNLNYALELKHDYLPAIRLLDSLENIQLNKNKETPHPQSYLDVDEPEYFSYFELIFPDFIKKEATAILSFITIFFLLMGFIDMNSSGSNIPFGFKISPLFGIIQIISLILAVSGIKKIFAHSYHLLYDQLENVKNDDFRLFFNKHMQRMFGYFIQRNVDSKFKYSLKPNKQYEFLFISSLITIDVFATIIVLFTQDFNLGLSTLSLLSRVVQNLIFWFSLLVAFRVLIFMTLFFLDYSNKLLVPVIAKKIKYNGFYALIQIISLTLIYSNLFWVSNVLTAYFTTASANSPTIDIFVVTAGSLIICTWAVMIPLIISAALKRSKALVLNEYNFHIKQAFSKFIKEPNESTVKKIDWLLKHQDRATNISNKIFSTGQLLKYFFTLSIIIMFTILYILLRLDFTELPFL